MSIRMALALVGFGWMAAGAARAEQNVDPAAVIRQARMAASLQQSDLHGVIRKGRTKIPVSLFLRGKNIQFALNGGALRFHMRLLDDRCELREIVDGKTRIFPASKLEGGERVNGSDCWKIRLDNPGRDGNFGVVYVWVNKKYGAFMRIRGHDRKGRLLKQFEVEEVMNIGKGVYTIRKMKVDTMNPTTGRVAGSTWIEFDRPGKKKDPGGLRR